MLESEIHPPFEQIASEQGAKAEILELAARGDKQSLRERLQLELQKLRDKVELFREAKKSGDIEKANVLLHSFEKESELNKEKDLNQMLLDGLLETRNRLIKEYWDYVKKYRGYLGFSDPDDWRSWKRSLVTSYEGHKNFERWPTLMKASIIIGQVDRLKERLRQARELEESEKKYKVD